MAWAKEGGRADHHYSVRFARGKGAVRSDHRGGEGRAIVNVIWRRRIFFPGSAVGKNIRHPLSGPTNLKLIRERELFKEKEALSLRGETYLNYLQRGSVGSAPTREA